ncbi:type IV secretory system conjugative DNA transfer family protein [Ruminococcaceae bacterium OttesenSCG-928-L11]|nr:type IV secretory system conjugative DNA transfer family protein [Ruminococcaceae bacterium OttesenSCG-928-L11]
MLPLIILCGSMLIILVLVSFGSNQTSLNIKSKRVGDGQHGTARWATPKEIRSTYRHIPYTPTLWRQGQNRPPVEDQGLVVGCVAHGKKTIALVDTGDVHLLMIGAAGVGKTANFLYPNLEYACASGMSFITSDTKGDLYRNFAGIAQNHYGYRISVIDLRNPAKSDGSNMIALVNKYMDLAASNSDNLVYRSRAEKYAKITAKTIIDSGGGERGGTNAYFYDAAEGILTSTILLIAELCPAKKRHIISVFKIIQDLLAPSDVKGKNQFQILLELLPPEHKARWFAGAALSTSEQAMLSILSTAMSRLNAFLDSELESILCFDTALDTETFCREKSAIFICMPEEDNTRHFFISLLIQQIYREMLAIADENGGKLQNRVVMLLDEFGTLPKIESAEMMFSAGRSRRISMVPIIQSFAQLDKNYGKEGSEIITDNTQLTLFGGFAPNSKSAETLSKSLGSQTVSTGSVSKGKNDPSRSLQMMERHLMTADELKSLPFGNFVLMKTGVHPMQTKLNLYFKWGIELDTPYEVPAHTARKVEYADRNELMDAILKKYPLTEMPAPSSESKKKVRV